MAKTQTQKQATVTASIPQPKPRPLVGNMPDLDVKAPVQSMMKLAEELGPFYRLDFPSQSLLVLGTAALAAEACDETRFQKHVHSTLKNIRDFAGDGLFTAYGDEPNWGKAHRTLMPAFGPQAMRNYFDDMLDIADQMLTKWERLGPEATLDVPDQMTRLTLDTIALCGFAYRFNSFYQNEMHPFVDAMVRSLAESGNRSRRLPLASQLMLLTQRQFNADVRYMHGITDELIRKRKAMRPEDAPRDLLGLMLSARDPVTGEGLDDDNIRYQLVTFLIAGHETTSGLLSFAIHLLLEHPEVRARAQAEVDRVLGRELPRFEQVQKLGYIDQILRETLRLYPTAPAFAVKPTAPTTLAGVHPLTPDDVLMVVSPILHRDPEVWADPERFDPDRFAPERRAAIPPHAWLPFGNGARACIGRAFALQEATLVLAMLLQRFELSRPAPYTLEIKETLTLKPDGLTLRTRLRQPIVRAPSDSAAAAGSAALRVSGAVKAEAKAGGAEKAPAHGTPLLVLFGSNSGASEAFARRIASDGEARGWATEVAALDERVGRLPTKGAVVIVSASYNGQPPDNARRFYEWAGHAEAGSLAGVRFAVFGCGNRDWAATYQAVPSYLDAQLRRAGAEPLCDRGEADARGDFFGDFERWYAPVFERFDAALGVTSQAVSERPLYAVEPVPSSGAELVLQNKLQLGTLVESRELVDLSSPLGRSKKHLEIALPEGATYEAGDYLAVLPENHPELIARLARRFGLRTDAAIVLRSSRGAQAASLPTDRPVSVQELLGRHVELSAPATQKDLARMAARTQCPPHQAQLAALAADRARYQAEVLQKRVSLLDLLERYPACELTFAEVLELLPAMRVRQYSISSSPKRDPRRCTLTVAVVDAPAWSGSGTFHGTCSSYLSRLQPGERVAVAVRKPHNPFHPPASNATPMVLICAGTGLAPFRGFLEERALRQAAGEETARSLLFFGCDHPEVDFLYREQLAAWEAAGVVSVRPAFFKQPVGEVTFVQHRLWQERAEVRALVDAGASLFLCGDGQRMAPAVRETLARIHQEAAGCSDEEAQAWLSALEREGRFVADVFA